MKRKFASLLLLIVLTATACFQDKWVYDTPTLLYLQLVNNTAQSECLNDSLMLVFVIENLSSDTLNYYADTLAVGGYGGMGLYANYNDELRIRVLNVENDSVLVDKKINRGGNSIREDTRSITYCKGDDVELVNL